MLPRIDHPEGGTISVDERTRHLLHQRLDAVLGHEEAGTLMSYLPPVGWADVATKRDLDHLEQRIEQRFETALLRETGALRSEMAAQTRTLFFSTSGLMLTLAGLAFAAARLA